MGSRSYTPPFSHWNSMSIPRQIEYGRHVNAKQKNQDTKSFDVVAAMNRLIEL